MSDDLVEPDDREWTIGRAIRNGGHHHPTIEGSPWPPVDEPVVVVPKSRLEAKAVAGTERERALTEALAEAAEALKYARNGLDLGLGAMRSLKRDEAVHPTDAEVVILDRYLKEARASEEKARAALPVPDCPAGLCDGSGVLYDPVPGTQVPLESTCPCAVSVEGEADG